MKILLAISLILATLVTAASAQAELIKASFNASTEADLDHYDLKYAITPEGTIHDFVDNYLTKEIAKDQVTSELSIPAGYYCFTLTATDTSDNESENADPICLAVLDKTPPAKKIFTIEIVGR